MSQPSDPTMSATHRSETAPTIAFVPGPGKRLDATNALEAAVQARQLPKIEGFEVIEEIGRGGMGVVYRAQSILLRRMVALKMILHGHLVSDQEIDRFHREAQTVASLDHSGIVPIYRVGHFRETPYFTMKLVEGGRLRDRIEELRTRPREAALLLAEVAEAVHHAHQRGILHRDLKPSNILLDEDGQPMITDFGVARRFQDVVVTLSGSTTSPLDSARTMPRLTRTGGVVGTPRYISPEQASSDPDLTTATDIYSLGAILYEMLTGRPPHLAETDLQTLLQVIEQPILAPHEINDQVDRSLELICLKCLQKKPEDRYSSADALAKDLRNYLTGEPISVRPPSLNSVLTGWIHQNFSAAGWIVGLGLSGGLLFGVLSWLALVLPRMSRAFQEGYAVLELPGPWLFLAWDPPRWAMATSLVGLFAVLSMSGLLTAILAKPRDRKADVIAGLVIGLLISLVSIPFSGGWGPVASFALKPGRLEMEQVIQASQTGSEALARRYPGLAELSPEVQGQVIASKIYLDQLLGIPIGLIVGLGVLVAFVTASTVWTSTLAGSLIRRHNRKFSRVLLPYSELALMGTATLLLTTFLAITYVGRHEVLALQPWRLPCCYVSLALALAATLARWPTPIRIVCQVLWICWIASLLYIP